MINKILTIFSIALLLSIGLYFFLINKDGSREFNPRDSAFSIDGKTFTLKDGIAKVSIPGSSSYETVKYFGNEAVGDINGDGMEDIAFLVTSDSGGTGIFYYVVVAIKSAKGYTNTNAFLIGDRIAPQSTEIHSDSQELHVNFAIRKDGEPMSTPPSIGAVLLLKVSNSGILEGLMK